MAVQRILFSTEDTPAVIKEATTLAYENWATSPTEQPCVEKRHIITPCDDSEHDNPHQCEESEEDNQVALFDSGRWINPRHMRLPAVPRPRRTYVGLPTHTHHESYYPKGHIQTNVNHEDPYHVIDQHRSRSNAREYLQTLVVRL